MGKLLLPLVPDLNNIWHFFVFCLWCYSIWSLTSEERECKGERGEVRGPRHKSDPHRNVVLTLMVQSKGQSDVTGIWAGKRQTDGQQRRGTHTKPPKNLAEYIKGVARSRFLTHFRFSHELNMAPWGFVNSRPVCIFREAVIAVSVRSSRLNKPKWEVFEHGYQLGCFILVL